MQVRKAVTDTEADTVSSSMLAARLEVVAVARG
jgi:hypothetical protein